MFTGTNSFGSRTKYSSVLLLNATAQAVVGAFAPQVYTAYLKDYLIRNTLVPADAALNVTFVDHGLPISRAFKTIQKASSGISSAFLMAIAWMMVSDSQIQAIIKEREKDVKHQIMISGCSLSAYWIGNYLADIIW